MHSSTRGAAHYDKTTASRFNAPDGSFGVCYISENHEGAFVETLLRNPGATLIDEQKAKASALTVFTAKKKIQLICLFGRGLARLGELLTFVTGRSPMIGRKAGQKPFMRLFLQLMVSPIGQGITMTS